MAARSRRGERGFVRGAGAGFAASAPLGGRASRRGRPRGAPRGSSWGVETCVCKFAARRIFALAKIFLTTHMQLQIFLELQICKWLLIDFLLKACKFASRSLFFARAKNLRAIFARAKKTASCILGFTHAVGCPPRRRSGSGGGLCFSPALSRPGAPASAAGGGGALRYCPAAAVAAVILASVPRSFCEASL